tara:strand:+ start:1570 stop:1758 length:189 start_codon:yes stop_codon:yes gene_type:complete
MIEYFTRRCKNNVIRDIDNWEEIPDEDLWQDGEIKYPEIKDIIYHQVIKQGEWKLIRRKDEQ